MEPTQFHPTRAPVKRPSAESYILICLTSFGLTVVVTRTFLELTGYPQVGNSVLHIAHALWGGLLLIISALFMMILTNRWVFPASAVLAGIGVGLFIDEVGKFITQKNDYFFAPAAPIIFSAFLLLLLLFLLVRRSRSNNPRAAIYRALFGLQEVIDNELDVRVRDQILDDLELGRLAAQPHVAHLAETLVAYLNSASTPVLEYHPSFWARLHRRLRALGDKVGRRNHRRIIFALATIGSISAFFVGIALLFVWVSGQASQVFQSTLESAATSLERDNPFWFFVRFGLQFLTGLLYVGAMINFMRGREEDAIRWALFASLLAFAGVNLLNFYFDQFHALGDFAVNLLEFLIVLAYREWYLRPSAAA